MYARSAFIEARNILKLLISTKPSLHSIERKAFTVAIIIDYCRPFKQRKKVRLPDDIVPYGQLDIHNYMIELRDKVVAHRDLDGPVTDWGFISQLELNFRAKELSVNTTSPSMPEDTARKALYLIDSLVAEMDRRVTAFAIRFIRMPHTDATYSVSLDESPSEWMIPIKAPSGIPD